jgi:hypothetical protein
MLVSSRKFAMLVTRCALANSNAKDGAAILKSCGEIAEKQGIAPFGVVAFHFLTSGKDDALDWASKQLDSTGAPRAAKKK